MDGAWPRYLVVGSQKAHNPLEFKNACRSIGGALASRGHTMVAAGCGDQDAETWVLDGANAAAQPDKKPNVIPFEPALPNTQDLIVRKAPGIAAQWPNLLFKPPFRTKGPWAVGQAVALVRSDVALLIGGGDLTANVGALALELDKPYYAVSELGGAAKVIADGDL